MWPALWQSGCAPPSSGRAEDLCIGRLVLNAVESHAKFKQFGGLGSLLARFEKAPARMGPAPGPQALTFADDPIVAVIAIGHQNTRRIGQKIMGCL